MTALSGGTGESATGLSATPTLPWPVMPKQPPQCSSVPTSAREKLRAYYLLSPALGRCFGLWADRPSPPPSAASPPPTAAGRHASARSECCVRRPNTLVHDADSPRPYSSQRRPRSDTTSADPRWSIQRSAQPENGPAQIRPAGPGSEGTCNGVRSPARVSNWHL